MNKVYFYIPLDLGLKNFCKCDEEFPESGLNPYQLRQYAKNISHEHISRIDPPLVVKTYSAPILNYICNLIAEKKLNKDNFEIILANEGKITVHTINEEGELSDWPYGCLEIDYNDYDN